MQVRKSSVAKVSLTVATVLFVSGFFLLCDCPGWYALASTFAGVAAWYGAERIRKLAIACFVRSLVMTGIHTYGKIDDYRRSIERRRKLEQKRTTRERAARAGRHKTEPGYLAAARFASDRPPARHRRE